MRLDLESRLKDNHNISLKLWLRLQTCSALIENELRTQLRTKFNSTLPRFDYLAQLSIAPKGLKMTELSERLMVSNGNITTITNQLENEGLIKRSTNPQDGRSSVIIMTAEGKKLYQRMAKAQEKRLNELLNLNTTTANQLYKSLGQLKNSLLKSQ